MGAPHSWEYSSWLALWMLHRGSGASQPWVSGGLCCVCDALGTRAGVGERHLLSRSAVCDSQCLCSRFQQSWAHPCLLCCSGWFNLLDLSMALCLVESGGNVVSSGREGCQAAFFSLLFVVKPYKVHPGPHGKGLSSSQACTYPLFRQWSRQPAQSLHTCFNFWLNYAVLLKIKEQNHSGALR